MTGPLAFFPWALLQKDSISYGLRRELSRTLKSGILASIKKKIPSIRNT